MKLLFTTTTNYEITITNNSNENFIPEDKKDDFIKCLRLKAIGEREGKHTVYYRINENTLIPIYYVLKIKEVNK